jgi:hypothetical protein
MTGELDLSDYEGLDHLSPREAAPLARLRGWLSERVWSPSQANAVLCGYDPEVGLNTSAADMAFLAGAHDFYGVSANASQPDDLRALDAGIEEQLGYIGGLGLTTMPPKDAIAKTVAARVPIPWLIVARADPVCRKLMPPEALKGSSGEGVDLQKKTPRQIAGSANSRLRWGGDDTHKMIVGTGWETFEALRVSGFKGVRRHAKGRWKDRLNQTDIVNEIMREIAAAAPDECDDWPDPQSVKRAVKKWLSSGE